MNGAAGRRRGQRRQYALTQREAMDEAEQQKHQTVQTDDGHEYRNCEGDILDQIGARRAGRADKKRDRHDIQQHHAIEGRRILWPEVVAPSRHETE
jgi:hypothetical protein